MGIEYNEEIEEYFGPMLGAVIRTCQLCRSGNLCSDWLARAPTTVPRAPAFCPYADRLDGLALDQAVIPPRRHTVQRRGRSVKASLPQSLSTAPNSRPPFPGERRPHLELTDLLTRR